MTARLVLVAIPVLTALAVAALRAEAVGARIDRWATTLALPTAIALAGWTGALSGLGLVTAVLVWVIASLTRWCGPPVPVRTRALDQLILAGWLVVACVADSGSLDLPLWAATALVVGLAITREVVGASPGPAEDDALNNDSGQDPIPEGHIPQRDPGHRHTGQEAIAAGALLLVLFGLFAAGTSAGISPLLGFGCRMIGLAGLLVLLPSLLPLSPLLLLALGAGIGHAEAAVLLAGGMAGLLLCATAGVARALPPERAAVLGQISLAAAAIGLGTEAGAFAALVLLLLLVLSETAHTLVTRSRIAASRRARPFALLAMAGVPPLGTFAGLALVLTALAERSAWLVPAAGLGLAMLGWTLIRQAATRRGGGSDAPGGDLVWVPLGLALVLGLLTPAPLADWLRTAAGTSVIHRTTVQIPSPLAPPPHDSLSAPGPQTGPSPGRPRRVTT